MDQHGQDHPLVAVAPGRVGVAGANRVAMAGLAIDLAAGVTLDGIVADQGHATGRDQVAQNEAAQQATEVEAGPGSRGEDALVGGAVAGSQAADGAQEVGHGAPTGGEDGGDEQELEPSERRGGEGWRQGQQQRCGLGRQSR